MASVVYHSDMSNAAEFNAFDRGIDPVLRIILSNDKARNLAEYQADRTLQDRIEELAGKCNEGNLTDDERAEYEGYVRANNFVAVLQAKARKLLANSKA